MAAQRGLIQWDYDGIQRESVALPYAADLPAIQQYASALLAYSRASVRKVAFIQTEYLYLPSSIVGGETPDTDVQAVAHLRDVNPDDEHEQGWRNQHVYLPAPDLDIFEDYERWGLRMKPDVGAALAAAHSVLMSREYEFVNGYLVA
jgi:hypothetical protein